MTSDEKDKVVPKSSLPMIHPSETGEDIDEARKRVFNEYLDEVLPPDPKGDHPFRRFRPAEIVFHRELGWGIITGFRMPDFERELEGLGVQFVRNGCMAAHKIFTPKESLELGSSGIIFDSRNDSGTTLEELMRGKHPEFTGSNE